MPSSFFSAARATRSESVRSLSGLTGGPRPSSSSSSDESPSSESASESSESESACAPAAPRPLKCESYGLEKDAEAPGVKEKSPEGVKLPVEVEAPLPLAVL